MNLSSLIRRAVLVGGLTLPLAAGDYDDVLKSVRSAWPDKTTGAAICSVDFNQLALMDLAESAKTLNINLLIMNVKSPKELRTTLNVLLAKRPGFLVLIDEDPVLGVKSGNTRFIIAQAGARKIPTVAITEEAIKLGAVFAIGPATGGKLITNQKEANRMGVPLPEEMVAIQVEEPK